MGKLVKCDNGLSYRTILDVLTPDGEKEHVWFFSDFDKGVANCRIATPDGRTDTFTADLVSPGYDRELPAYEKRLNDGSSSLAYEQGMYYYDDVHGAVSEPEQSVQDRVVSVGNRIAKAAETYLRANGREDEIKNLRWEFNAISKPESNAFAREGGKIAIYTGSFKNWIKTDDELAIILGHEVAHSIQRHTSDVSHKVKGSLSSSLQNYFIGNGTMSSRNFKGTSKEEMSNIADLKMSRGEENEADRLGLVLAHDAGYDISGAKDLWGRMYNDIEKRNHGNSEALFADHDLTSRRMQNIERWMNDILGRSNNHSSPVISSGVTDRITSSLEKIYGKGVSWNMDSPDLLRNPSNVIGSFTVYVHNHYGSPNDIEDARIYKCVTSGTEDRLHCVIKDDNGNTFRAYDTSLKSFNKDFDKNIKDINGSHCLWLIDGENNDFIGSNYILGTSRGLSLPYGESKRLMVKGWLLNTVTGESVYQVYDRDDPRKSYYYHKPDWSTTAHQKSKWKASYVPNSLLEPYKDVDSEDECRKDDMYTNVVLVKDKDGWKVSVDLNDQTYVMPVSPAEIADVISQETDDERGKALDSLLSHKAQAWGLPSSDDAEPTNEREVGKALMEGFEKYATPEEKHTFEIKKEESSKGDNVTPSTIASSLFEDMMSENISEENMNISQASRLRM